MGKRETATFLCRLRAISTIAVQEAQNRLLLCAFYVFSRLIAFPFVWSSQGAA